MVMTSALEGLSSIKEVSECIVEPDIQDPSVTVQFMDSEHLFYYG